MFMVAAEKIAADAAWYERQNEARRRKVISDATTGVTHIIVDAVSEGRVSAVAKTGGEYAALQNMATLKDGIDKLKSTPFHKWTRDQKKAFMDSWRDLAKALIGRKRIVVCTAGNALSSLLVEAFQECKHVVIILDEASLCTDPALWNVVVNLFKSDRIEAEFEGRTPVRAVVLVGDHHQGKAVIKSELVG